MVRFSLREEDVEEFIDYFRLYLDGIAKINDRLSQILNEEMKNTKYDELQTIISKILDQYQETVNNNIDYGVFSLWAESEVSLVACIRNYEAGEDAENVGLFIQNKLADLMQQLLQITKVEFSVPDRPVLSDESFEKIEDILKVSVVENQDLRNVCINNLTDKSENNNNIYGVLAPLVHKIYCSLDDFLNSAFNQVKKLHEITQERIRDFFQDNNEEVEKINYLNNRFPTITFDESTDKKSNGQSVSPKIKREYSNYINQIGYGSGIDAFYAFENLTKSIYQSMNDQVGCSAKTISTDVIKDLSDIYVKFYETCGSLLQDRFLSDEERIAFAEEEYIKVTKNRGNDQFFSDFSLFEAEIYASSDYTCFKDAAAAMKKIAEISKQKSKYEVNLIYDAYVTFTPILEGNVLPKDAEKFQVFFSRIEPELRNILCADENNHSPDQTRTTNERNKTIKETYNPDKEDNVNYLVRVIEELVKHFGGDVIIKYVNENSDELGESTEFSSKINKLVIDVYHKVSDRKEEKNRSDVQNFENKIKNNENIFGKYHVTYREKSIMKPYFNQVSQILNEYDNFYGERFEKVNKNYTNASSLLGVISTVFSFGENAVKKIKEVCGENILGDRKPEGFIPNVFNALSMLYNPALISAITREKNAAEFGKKIVDKCRKSSLLSKIQKYFWDKSIQQAQLSQIQRFIGSYMFERYQIKYNQNISINDSIYFQMHALVNDETNKSTIRIIEKAGFSAEWFAMEGNLMNYSQNEEKMMGLYFNLVRSALDIQKNFEPKKATSVTDKWFNLYRKCNPVIPDLSFYIK